MTILLALPLLLAAQAPPRPTPAETEKLVEKFFLAGADERKATLARLETLEPLSRDAAKTWAKKCLAHAAKGPTSPGKSRNYLYDAEAQRGLYLLGGRRPGLGPLFFGLHGGGKDSGDAESAHGPWSGGASSRGWLAVFPEVLAKTEAAWGDEPTEEFVLDLVETMKRTVKIDTNRIYLGGHSMGGYGAWTLGARHADLFAGLVAFAGAPTPEREGGRAMRTAPGVLPNLRNTPIWVYHSRDDAQVDFGSNEVAVAELKRLQKEHGGYEHVFEVADGRGHEFPNPNPALDWLEKHKRDPRPKKVVWQPFRPTKRMFYWLWWEKPKADAVVVAEITGPNQIEVRSTADLAGLTVLLDDRMVDLERDVTIRVNGQERFRAKAPRELAAVVLTAEERNDPEMVFVARVRL